MLNEEECRRALNDYDYIKECCEDSVSGLDGIELETENHYEILNQLIKEHFSLLDKCENLTKCLAMNAMESIDDSVEILQELVDKATPKAIVMKNDGFYCPECGLKIETRLFYSHYCNYCGQRLG